MNHLLALLCACCAFTAVASSQGTSDKMAVEVKVSLEPKKIHEECARLDAGQSRRWYWKSDVPIDFNIHYHRGNDVFYPVKRDAMRGDGGTFAAKTAEDYCWMWAAKDAAAKIEGRIQK